MPLPQIEEWSASRCPFFACLVDRDQLMRILVRQRSQEDMIDYRKHRGGCAETEGKGCNHRDGEYGRSSQLPEGVFQVLSEALEPDPSPGFAGYVFDQRDVAKLTDRRCTRLFRGRAAVLAILDVHLKMSLNLLIELCFAFCEQAE